MPRLRRTCNLRPGTGCDTCAMGGWAPPSIGKAVSIIAGMGVDRSEVGEDTGRVRFAIGAEDTEGVRFAIGAQNTK
jgi:hypothetical protein